MTDPPRDNRLGNVLPPSPRPRGLGAWLPLLLILVAGPLLYAVGMGAASMQDRQPWSQSLWLEPAATDTPTPLRVATAVTAGVGAVAILFVTPWLLGTCAFRRMQRRRAAAGAWSLAVNSLAFVLVCSLLRVTIGIHRESLLAAWLAWTAVWLCLTGRPTTALAEIRSLWCHAKCGLLVGLATVAVSITLLHREQFVQCFEGDGTEVFELAHSLQDHFLPYWEIDELQQFGTVNVYPAMIDSYWTFGLQVLLGPGEPATRLPYWIWWLAIFLTALQMIQPEGPPALWRPALPLALAVLLTALFYTFYNGYYPYMTDLASPGVPDAMLTLLVLLSLWCLDRGDLPAWAVMLALTALTSYAGPVMLVLTTAAALIWRPVSRPRMLRAAFLGASLTAFLFFFYIAWGWREGVLHGWWSTLIHESFVGYYSKVRPSASSAAFIGYFLLGSGGVAALGLWLPFRRRASQASSPGEIGWQRTVASVTCGYLAIILGAQCKNLHYLGPLFLMPLILWLRRPTSRLRWWNDWPVWTASASYLVCLALCWPTLRPTFTLNRQFGQLTTFQTEHYEEAVAWSKIIHPLYQRGLISWEIGPHTWVYYAHLAASPTDARPFLVTTGLPPSPQYELLFESPQHVKVYSRDPRLTEWLRQQQPPIGPERSPAVLRAATTSPEPQRELPQP